MSEHPIGERIEVGRAQLERVFWHMVGIINTNHKSYTDRSGQTKAWQEIGTGAACLFRGRKLILTAAHVLDGAEKADVEFLPRGTGRIEWADESNRTRADRVAVVIDKIVRCAWEDLAAIVLSENVPESVNIRFCELPQKFSEPPAKGNVLVIGYPYDQAVEVERLREKDTIVHKQAAISDGFLGEVVTTSKLLSGFDAERHFLVRFYPSRREGRPQGYSGAGVWLTNSGEAAGGIWNADPLLTGIETHGYENSGLLRVVRSNFVRLFLEEVISEL
jgi:Trypsin-like peptidase domain